MLDFNHVKTQSEKIDIEQLKHSAFSQLERVLYYLFPAGEIRHGKFHIGDVRGNKGKSLVIDLHGNKAGLWHDFESGEGGDIFKLWGLANGFGDNKSEFPKVLESISEYLGAKSPRRRFNGFDLCDTNIRDSVNDSINHDSNSPVQKSYLVDELGKPTTKWDYHDKDGELIACVYRYDTPQGKEFRPWDVKTLKGKAPEIRPLYRIPDLDERFTVILVEGEKCVDALHSVGLTATTAMNGAKAPLDKTDWSPLEGKSVIVWPDNDAAGKEYGKKVSEYLKGKVAEVVLIEPPTDKPRKWDCADAVAEGMNVKDFILKEISRVMKEKTIDRSMKQDSMQNIISTYEVECCIDEKAPMPDELISPRILTLGGLITFGGPPTVDKSNFLLSLLIHMSEGKEFCEMRPSRPLRIFYLQAELSYHYLRERIQKIALGAMIEPLIGDNLVITPQLKIVLDDDGMSKIHNSIKQSFYDNPVDIIVIDPRRSLLSAKVDGNEDENSAIFLLQQRLKSLRDKLNNTNF